MVDLVSQYEKLKPEIDQAVLNVIGSSAYLVIAAGFLRIKFTEEVAGVAGGVARDGGERRRALVEELGRIVKAQKGQPRVA